MNPDVLLIPVVGMRQLLYFPSFVDELTLGPGRKLRLIGPFSHLINSISQSAPGTYALGKKINYKVGSITRHSKLKEMGISAKSEGLQRIYPDFTPMVYYNGDAALMNWYNTEGKVLARAT